MKKINLLFSSIVTAALTMTTLSCSDKGDANYAPQAGAEGMMAINNIMTRTSVRQYTGREIPEDTVTIMLKAAMAAPSAMNKQPWEFIILRDAAKRDKIGEALPGVGDKTKTAGAVILVCGNTKNFIEQAPEYWVQDCSAATENLLLAANALQLGAVWCGVYPVMERVNDVRNILGLPENLIPLNVVTIGYPTAIETPKDKWDAGKVVVI